MATPGPSSQSAMADAAKHALADVDAVRTGMRRDGVSDREFLNALELMVSLQRQVNGTVSVLMAAAEARHAAERATNTPLEVMLTTSGQESVPQVRNQVFLAGILSTRPNVHAAAAAGKITLSQARAIRDVVENLPPVVGQRAEGPRRASAPHGGRAAAGRQAACDDRHRVGSSRPGGEGHPPSNDRSSSPCETHGRQVVGVCGSVSPRMARSTSTGRCPSSREHAEEPGRVNRSTGLPGSEGSRGSRAACGDAGPAARRCPDESRGCGAAGR